MLLLAVSQSEGHAPSHADLRVLAWSGLILQLFQRARKIDFPLCSQRLVSMTFAKCIHLVTYGHLHFVE